MDYDDPPETVVPDAGAASSSDAPASVIPTAAHIQLMVVSPTKFDAVLRCEGHELNGKTLGQYQEMPISGGACLSRFAVRSKIPGHKSCSRTRGATRSDLDEDAKIVEGVLNRWLIRGLPLRGKAEHMDPLVCIRE